MKKKDFLNKIKEMQKEHNAALLKECERLFDCGGVETSSYENDYLLPKTIMYVALFNESLQYKPLNSENKKDADNLKHF